MADAVWQPIRASHADVVRALVENGVPLQEAQRLATSNGREWGVSVGDRARWEWVIGVAQAYREGLRGRAQADAGHASEPNSPEARRQVLMMAAAIGVPGVNQPGSTGGYHTDGSRWTNVERAAVQEFQRRRGLPATGAVDAATIAEVQSINAWLAGMNAPPAAPASGGGGGATGPIPAADRVPSFVAGGGGPGASPASPGAGSGWGGGDVAQGTGPGAFTPGVGTLPATQSGVANPDGLFAIPGGAEIWQVGGSEWFAVYRVPGSRTPLAWKIEGHDDLTAIFGPGKAPTPTRRLNAQEWGGAGVLVFGSSRLLANMSEHPFDAFVANFSTEARARPWMRDPEILALTGRALLEGREVTEAELAGTKWWQTHTPGERQWLRMSNMDPAGAAQMVEDRRNATRVLMQQTGISDPPETLVRWVADRITGGTWSEAYAFGQITKIADPAAPVELDGDIAPLLSSLTLNTLSDNTSKVDELVTRWLGPAFADGWTKQQKEFWAGRLRNDPTAEEELVEELRQQRLNLFPEYTNPNASYESIAVPWRGVWTQMWGEQADETDPLFSQVVRTNDLAEASEILRREGLKRNNATVTTSMLSAVGRSDLGAGAVRGTI